MKNQLLTRNFVFCPLGIPTRRVGIPDSVVKNEGVCPTIQSNCDCVRLIRHCHV